MSQGPGFQGQEDLSQNVKNRCLIIRYLLCHKDRATQIKFISSNTSYLGKKIKLFQAVKGGPVASLEASGSQLPLAHNNLHVKVTHFGEVNSEPLHLEVALSAYSTKLTHALDLLPLPILQDLAQTSVYLGILSDLSNTIT